MNFIVSANTDIGISKETNQDSLSIKVLNTSSGKMVFAILCDGMGGLSKGEVASASVIRAFEQWVMQSFPYMSAKPIDEYKLREQWENIIRTQNIAIKEYGARQGVKLGTTAIVLLLTENKYYALNVGDSRIYEITDNVYQITKDQTFVAREVELGNLSEEVAKNDPRRSVLLQCVGASDEVYPELITGNTKLNATYMLCSDGFRHEITNQEIYEKMQPNVLLNDEIMFKNTFELIELNKMRNERDNISVAMIRTF